MVAHWSSQPAADPLDVDVVVVGAGQAGLGVGFWLARSDLSFVILDAAAHLGASWGQRWDSLTLFTPRRFSSLPGLRFPSGPGRYPTKSEVAGYLRRYAARFDLPVQLDRRVERVARAGEGFDVETAEERIRTRHVVVATGPFRGPYVPPAAAGLSPQIRQLHSASYRTPADVDRADVLVVGGGNSAAQLATELAGTRRVTVASPGPLWFLPQRIIGVDLYWWLSLTGVLNAPAEGRVSRYVRSRGDAIIGRDLADLVACGRVRHVPHRVVGAQNDAFELEDGTRVTASAVLWCTGFRPDYSWLRIPGALSHDGVPVHSAGASPVPGLHWMGLPWQTRLNSSIIDGVDRDARATVARMSS